VPGQALGYSLQFTRLTHLLLSAPEGSFGSFEVLDDVALEEPGGQFQFVQSKSALTANPLADRSVALWKTLANWVDALAAGGCDPEKLRLVLYVPRPADGEIARRIAKAKTLDEAKAAIAFAKRELLGDHQRIREPAGELEQHLARFFEANPEMSAAVVRAFEIQCGSGSPQADIANEIAARFVPAEKVSLVADYACGWVKRRVDELLEKRQASVLSRDEFHREMTAFVRKHVERAILHSFAPAPTPMQAKAHMPKTFVQQLQIIEKDFEDQMEAISQFYRASYDRVLWGKNGEIHGNSLDELDRNLMATWKNLKTIAFANSPQSPDAVKGQVLLAHCLQHQATVENLQPPAHFIPGCFHMLADVLKVGWHPDYQNKLKKRRSKEDKR